jgi:hypothetical protein
LQAISKEKTFEGRKYAMGKEVMNARTVYERIDPVRSVRPEPGEVTLIG